MRFRGKYNFLSNFHSSPFWAGGVLWPTVEHFYQAMKTTDPEERESIRKLKTPGATKRRGKTITLREDWDDIKLEVMAWALERKFHIPHFREALVATAPEPIVEENDWGDTYWGVCNGRGENHLGRLLTELRDNLINNS